MLPLKKSHRRSLILKSIHGKSIQEVIEPIHKTTKLIGHNGYEKATAI
ncbi:unnamed protein product [Acidithrix sp. C25]|nr:unnamed protein product [Acidithrix sp. C25]